MGRCQGVGHSACGRNGPFANGPYDGGGVCEGEFAALVEGVGHGVALLAFATPGDSKSGSFILTCRNQSVGTLLVRRGERGEGSAFRREQAIRGWRLRWGLVDRLRWPAQ